MAGGSHDPVWAASRTRLFETVVILKQQVRVTDATWKTFLGRLRVGETNDADVNMLREFDSG